MSALKRAAQLALFGFMLAAPMAAQAQEQSAAQAACHPVTDPNEDPIINEHTMAGTHGGVMLWQSVKKKGCAFYDKLNNLLNKEAEAVVPKYDSLPETQKKNWLQKLLTPSEVIAAEEPPLTGKAMEENDAAVQAEMWAHDINNPEYRRKLVNNGEKTFPNGAIYDGEMKDGEPSGVGVLVFPDGGMERGEFTKGGHEQGLGEDVRPDGEMRAGRIADGQLVSGADQLPNGIARSGLFAAQGSPVGLVEIDLPDGNSQDYYLKDGKILAEGPLAKGDAEPVPPPAPPGFPPEPVRDVPLWSPEAPVGTIMAEEMRWDPDAKLDWAALSPDDGTDPLGNARFCRPLTGTLTSLQQQQCNQDRNEVTAKLKSKDPIGERMFCQPLTGYMPPDLMEACGIKPEPPPAPVARAVGGIGPGSAVGNGLANSMLGGMLGTGNSGVRVTQTPAPQQQQQQQQQRVAVAAPPPPSGKLSLDLFHKNCGSVIEAQAAGGTMPHQFYYNMADQQFMAQTEAGSMIALANKTAPNANPPQAVWVCEVQEAYRELGH